jgi:hypothetical protein
VFDKSADRVKGWNGGVGEEAEDRVEKPDGRGSKVDKWKT